jgi:hypothetical protein
MRLTDIPALLIEDILRKMKRLVIGGIIVAACGFIAFLEILSAAKHGLEPLVGPVGARLILAGVFLVFAAVGAFVFLRSEKPDRPANRDAGAQSSTEQRVAVIAEAISLGYSLARDYSKASEADRADKEAQPRAATDEPTESASRA